MILKYLEINKIQTENQEEFQFQVPNTLQNQAVGFLALYLVYGECWKILLRGTEPMH